MLRGQLISHTVITNTSENQSKALSKIVLISGIVLVAACFAPWWIRYGEFLFAWDLWDMGYGSAGAIIVITPIFGIVLLASRLLLKIPEIVRQGIITIFSVVILGILFTKGNAVLMFEGVGRVSTAGGIGALLPLATFILSLGCTFWLDNDRSISARALVGSGLVFALLSYFVPQEGRYRGAKMPIQVVLAYLRNTRYNVIGWLTLLYTILGLPMCLLSGVIFMPSGEDGRARKLRLLVQTLALLLFFYTPFFFLLATLGDWIGGNATFYLLYHLILCFASEVVLVEGTGLLIRRAKHRGKVEQ